MFLRGFDSALSTPAVSATAACTAFAGTCGRAAAAGASGPVGFVRFHDNSSLIVIDIAPASADR